MRGLWPGTHFISLFLIFSCTFWTLAPSAPQVCLSLCFLAVVLFQTFFFFACFKDLPFSHLSVFPVAKPYFANVVQFLVLLFTDNSHLLILISPSLEIPKQSVRSSCG